METLLIKTRPVAPGPDRSAALAQYRQRAGLYDLELALFEPLRRRAIARLGLKHGHSVLDVGCGTGLSLMLLRQGVGAKGRIIGIEQCPEMIDQARARVAKQQLGKVSLNVVASTCDTLSQLGVSESVAFGFPPGAGVSLISTWYTQDVIVLSMIRSTSVSDTRLCAVRYSVRMW